MAPLALTQQLKFAIMWMTDIQNLNLTLILFGLQLKDSHVIGKDRPMQRPGPAVQTNSLVTKGKGIVTMILNVVRKRKNFNVVSTIAYK